MIVFNQVCFTIQEKKNNIPILEDVSFSGKKGNHLIFVGPNGSGKSTMLKVGLGVLKPTSGIVSVFGNPLTNASKNAYLKRTGYMSGNRSALYPEIPALDSLVLTASLYGVSRKKSILRIYEWAEILGLEKKLKSPVKQLSFGERVKFDIIGAFLHDPEIVFLDEPTVGLDESSKLALGLFIDSYVTSHDALIITATHDFDFLKARQSGFVHILAKGKIVYSGTISEIEQVVSEKTRFTVKFIDHEKIFDYKNTMESLNEMKDILALPGSSGMDVRKIVTFNDLILSRYNED